MEIATYFFDTYAFREIILGSKNYKKYALNALIVTSIFQLMELHYGLLKDHGKKVAEHYYTYFKKYKIEVDDNIIKKANEFKYQHRKKDLSYVDCIGYIIARTRNIKFLTGDKAFKGMEGVEFVR